MGHAERLNPSCAVRIPRSVITFKMKKGPFGRTGLQEILAEEVGFEPTVPCGTTVFKTAAFNHSAIPPNWWVLG